jgi:hypothetical protein
MAKFDSNVAIRIAADFVGLPAFKKADTAVDKLYKGTKKLAGAFGVAFSAQAIANYGAAAVRAFAAEERQIAQLTQTVTNLGLAFEASNANAFIEDLERMTGIAREELQPAFQKLITQTGSIQKSQKILRAALDISMSGLMSVSEAANILTQAYVGNNKGLRLLNLGFTSAELKAMGFEEILDKIGQTYKDSTKAALEGTEAKLKKIKIAAGNAQESIGGGLVDAFADLAGDGGNLDKANSKLERFGEILGGLFANAFNPVEIGGFYLPIPNLAKAFEKPIANIGSPAEWRRNNAKIIAAEKKAQEAALKREQARLDALRKQTNEKKAQVALDKAKSAISGVKGEFDLQGIQLYAASQADITEEQRGRVNVLQKIFELELAIEQNNTALIPKLTRELEISVQQMHALNAQAAATENIKKYLSGISMNNPLFSESNISKTIDALMAATNLSAKDLFNATNLDKALDVLAKISGTEFNFGAMFGDPFAGTDFTKIFSDLMNAASETVVNVTVNGAIDPEGTARTILELLQRSYGRGALPAELLVG